MLGGVGGNGGVPGAPWCVLIPGPAATVTSASVPGIRRVTSAGQTPVRDPGPGAGVDGGGARTV